MLSWDDYSHETPIFKLENIDGYRYKINWFGFWNVKSNNYNWTVSDEFFSGPELNTKESILYNCNFNNSSTTENETD
ncbi:hypothetical protein BCF53_10614 [Reinekea marinisedimentorum]|uniref:Uncharacterized protein n=2 Tax=Reinekea marinisedimentorum TaxID=230495 RepID=A0A4R3I6F7_9GAMM|nr:hypothetical protein BCF53_10614 [Reinekea marinisedimentorum]